MLQAWRSQVNAHLGASFPSLHAFDIEPVALGRYTSMRLQDWCLPSPTSTILECVYTHDLRACVCVTMSSLYVEFCIRLVGMQARCLSLTFFLLQAVCTLVCPCRAFAREAMALDYEDILEDRQASSYWLWLRPFNLVPAGAFVVAEVPECFSL